MFVLFCITLSLVKSTQFKSCSNNYSSSIFHMEGGGGGDSTLPQIFFFINSLMDAGKPQIMVNFSKICWRIRICIQKSKKVLPN